MGVPLDDDVAGQGEWILEIETLVLRSSLSICGETEAFASIWVKPNSLALATNPAMWLNLPLAHMVERETSNNLLSLAPAELKILLLALSPRCLKLVSLPRE